MLSIKNSGLMIITAFLFGCAAPQPAKISITPSGRPEATIRAPIEQIKSAIISEEVNYGYTVEKDTPYLLVLVRDVNGKENTGIAMTIGNMYSNNSRTASYTFASEGGSVRVVASMALRAQMPGGQVNTADINDNGDVYNTYQKQLNDIKARLEGAASK